MIRGIRSVSGDCGNAALRVAHVGRPPPPPKLQVQIDDDIAQGVYANLVLLNHTENEFVLDFAFIQPSNGRAKVRSRVISSPRHTKRLLLRCRRTSSATRSGTAAIELGPTKSRSFH